MKLIIIGFLSGVIGGIGVGGGILLIPALTILFDIKQQIAQGINLIYFIPTAITAVIIHIANHNIQKDVLLYLIITGILGACIGSMIAVNIDGFILKKIFGVFILAMGITEFFKK
ncbi:sulfite exporter TauE/SafE family protein [Crassaminicella indica]|uniref:Probable membrane transporter protein n=1 Tax=Crassaminicella indica TaxID=2855394 RepID=A0ABX8RDL8_9CLOT|nr:sulfite exporter TauE/SafE family protein [Crassaminicella indica]QXM07128.1 sulfite exporter TauE/SafE family protein [Crassaminicella indica]